jgi:hypothetical protein
MIGDTRAVPGLFEALEGSALQEYWAEEGLERMGVGMVLIFKISSLSQRLTSIICQGYYYNTCNVRFLAKVCRKYHKPESL